MDIKAPSTARPGETVNVDGSGFPDSKFMLTTVDSSGTESGFDDVTGFPTNINRPRPDGTFHVGIRVPPKEGPATIRAYVMPDQQNVRASASVQVAAIVVPPVDPPPVDPPPTGADWFRYSGPVPGGAKRWSSGSLGAFLSGLKAGEYGILERDDTVSESINLALKNGVTIVPAPGATPWLDGPLRISGGEGVAFYGLNVRWTNADSGGHMVKLDGGSIVFGYAELAHAACYTLLRPGQTLHDSRLHHMWVHDNPGVSSHDGNQDHGLYCSAESVAQNLVVDHLLVESMPRGRNIKVGGPSTGKPISGITIRKSSLRLGHGPSNAQVSNGATKIVFEDLVLIDSKDPTNLTAKTNPGLDSTYRHCAGDRKPVGPNDQYLKDLGGNVTMTVAQLSDFEAMGKLGFGHLAP